MTLKSHVEITIDLQQPEEGLVQDMVALALIEHATKLLRHGVPAKGVEQLKAGAYDSCRGTLAWNVVTTEEAAPL